jgi:hypothetical protein
MGMTPIEVILLTYKVRQAQKSFHTVLQSGEAADPPLMDRHNAMVALEEELDPILQSYVDYYRAIEASGDW